MGGFFGINITMDIAWILQPENPVFFSSDSIIFKIYYQK